MNVNLALFKVASPSSSSTSPSSSATQVQPTPTATVIGFRLLRAKMREDDWETFYSPKEREDMIRDCARRIVVPRYAYKLGKVLLKKDNLTPFINDLLKIAPKNRFDLIQRNAKQNPEKTLENLQTYKLSSNEVFEILKAIASNRFDLICNKLSEYALSNEQIFEIIRIAANSSNEDAAITIATHIHNYGFTIRQRSAMANILKAKSPEMADRVESILASKRNEEMAAMSAVKLEEALKNAKALYEEKNGRLQQEDKSNINAFLQEAYVAFKTCYDCDPKQALQKLPQFAEVFFMYGNVRYGENMKAVCGNAQISLVIQLVRLGLLKYDIEEFLDKEQLADYDIAFQQNDHIHRLCDPFDLYLLEQPSADAFVETLKSKIDKEEHIFLIGKTFKLLQFTLQNIPERNKTNQSLFGAEGRNYKRFAMIYSTCKVLFEGIEKGQCPAELQKEAEWELFDLVYNSGRFRYRMDHPNNVIGSLKTLKSVKDFICNKEMDTPRGVMRLAQIFNIKALTYQSASEDTSNLRTISSFKAKAKKHIEKAVSLLANIEGEKGSNDFIISSIRLNFYFISLATASIDFDAMAIFLKDEIDRIQENSISRTLYPKYWVAYAKVLVELGKMTHNTNKMDEARKALITAEDLIRKNRDQMYNDEIYVIMGVYADIQLKAEESKETFARLRALLKH